MIFQACCRGAIARRELKMKIGAIVTIQAGFKMVYAKKELEKRKKEVSFVSFVCIGYAAYLADAVLSGI